jgi:3-oxoacyl-[acyl-carrier protein] reductase
MSDDLSLRGRAILITGGTRGLGREIALGLVEAGARVMITARRHGPEMDEALSALHRLGGAECARGCAADVRSSADCNRAVTETVQAFGTVHVLFNNAGLGLQSIADYHGRPRSMFWETDDAPWQALVDTNVNGVFYMARAVAPIMIKQGFGKIINVSTNRHTMLRLGGSSYGGAKAFLELASRVWAKELEGKGVSVNVFLPGGPVDTGIRTAALPEGFKYHPISMMRAPARWLSSDLSNGHTSERYVARLWDENLPLPERIVQARESGIELPQIM